VLVHRGDYALDRLQASGGASLELTGNHPVFTLRGFVRTEDLLVGDTVFIVDEVAAQTRQERLISITRRASTSEVTYNLKTTAGNYFAADLLIHNKCLAGGSQVETRGGFVDVAAIKPGEEVRGAHGGKAEWAKVTAVYTKTTVLPALPGRRVNEHLTLTDNHILSVQRRPAGELNLPAVEVAGPVYDLETRTGNYFAGGVLVEAANSTLERER
jgi:intein/homing endonuclease